jgi:hypothetical protein
MSWIRKVFGGKREEKARPAPAEAVHPPIQVDLPPAPGDTLTGDQFRRKQWAEEMLRAEGVPLNPHLPAIESEAQTSLRKADEVADRLLALTLVGVKGEGIEQEVIEEIIDERNARALFTPAELAFIDDPDPTLQDRTQFSWRYEAAWVLLWALQHLPGPLGRPDRICDVPLLAAIVRDEADLARHGLRSANDILNEADLIYRYHWAIRQARLEGSAPPAGLDPGVTMERHHALNWLIGYNEDDWDDVSTDT